MIHTPYTLEEAAEEMTKIYERSKQSDLIIGFLPSGDVDSGYEGINNCTVLEVKRQYETIEEMGAEISNPDDWTKDDRESVFNAFSWRLEYMEREGKIGFCEPEDVTYLNEQSGLPQLEVCQDNGVNLRFSGELLGYKETTANDADSAYSGVTGMIQQLYAYRIHDGQYLLQKKTQWAYQESPDTNEILISSDLDELMEFFDPSNPADELLDEAGIIE